MVSESGPFFFTVASKSGSLKALCKLVLSRRVEAVHRIQVLGFFAGASYADCFTDDSLAGSQYGPELAKLIPFFAKDPEKELGFGDDTQLACELFAGALINSLVGLEWDDDVPHSISDFCFWEPQFGLVYSLISSEDPRVSLVIKKNMCIALEAVYDNQKCKHLRSIIDVFAVPILQLWTDSPAEDLIGFSLLKKLAKKGWHEKEQKLLFSLLRGNKLSRYRALQVLNAVPEDWTFEPSSEQQPNITLCLSDEEVEIENENRPIYPEALKLLTHLKPAKQAQYLSPITKNIAHFGRLGWESLGAIGSAGASGISMFLKSSVSEFDVDDFVFAAQSLLKDPHANWADTTPVFCEGFFKIFNAPLHSVEFRRALGDEAPSGECKPEMRRDLLKVYCTNMAVLLGADNWNLIWSNLLRLLRNGAISHERMQEDSGAIRPELACREEVLLTIQSGFKGIIHLKEWRKSLVELSYDQKHEYLADAAALVLHSYLGDISKKEAAKQASSNETVERDKLLGALIGAPTLRRREVAFQVLRSYPICYLNHHVGLGLLEAFNVMELKELQEVLDKIVAIATKEVQSGRLSEHGRTRTLILLLETASRCGKMPNLAFLNNTPLPIAVP